MNIMKLRDSELEMVVGGAAPEQPPVVPVPAPAPAPEPGTGKGGDFKDILASLEKQFPIILKIISRLSSYAKR